MRPVLVLVALSTLPVTQAWAQHAEPGVDARLFGDFNYFATERDIRDGFVHGQLVGHLAVGLADRFAFLAEVSATPGGGGFAITVERAVVRYEHSDALKLSAGRYHTPISYWNTAFHHGQWLQTTIGRPESVRFGGIFVPIHFVGLIAEGIAAQGPLSIRYAAGVGNGRQADLVGPGDAGDFNGRHAVTGSGSIGFPGIAGVQIGGGFYLDHLDAGAEVQVRERIVSAHLVRERDNPEFIAEWIRVIHDPVGDALPVGSTAVYGQIGYRLPAMLSAVKPYLRAERIDVPDHAPVFGHLGLGYDGIVAGVRYDFTTLAALKIEYRSERFEGEDRAGTFGAQVSFTVPLTRPSVAADPVAAAPLHSD